jgi:predicted aspartyl protease
MAKNLRGLVPGSQNHYLGIVGINNCIMEGIFDTGAARSMMDTKLAEAAGLKVDKAKTEG